MVMLKNELKRWIHFLGARVIALVSTLIPKNEKVIMFISSPEFSDNPRYLYETCKKMMKEYKFVWIVKNKERYNQYPNKMNTIFVEYRTLEYMKWILRAKYVVVSHGIPYWKSYNQIGILLWHGIPLKNISVAMRRIKVPFPNRYMDKKIDYMIIPSEFSGLLYSAGSNFLWKNACVLGQPRCDALFVPKAQSLKVLSDILGVNIEKLEKYTRVIIYLPTFRDYNPEVTKQITMGIINNSKFRDFLSQNNVLFIVKPHPHDEKLFEKYESDHIKIIKNEELLSRFLTLYDILPAVDILVTDYSSVYFDYLLLNRPIVFYIPDLEKYRETRGFLLEPYEKWTPGDKARTPEELVVALEEAINNPRKWERERLWLRDVMFKYQDGKASERIIKYFWGDI